MAWPELQVHGIRFGEFTNIPGQNGLKLPNLPQNTQTVEKAQLLSLNEYGFGLGAPSFGEWPSVCLPGLQPE